MQMTQTQQAVITITAADITADDRQNFSDMFKDIYGFRPRYTPTDQELSEFLNSYPKLFEEQSEQEAARLQYLREETGIQFPNWMAYYDYLDGKESAEWAARKIELAKEAAHKKELATPRSPRMAIEFWDYGQEDLIT